MASLLIRSRPVGPASRLLLSKTFAHIIPLVDHPTRYSSSLQQQQQQPGCCFSSASKASLSSLEGYSLTATDCNVPVNIARRVGMKLHQRPFHPLGILQQHIHEFWKQQQEQEFELLDDLSPIVSTRQNFDDLRIPANHVSRQPTDTYYLNADTVLRTHTSAHQIELLQQQKDRFLVSGDVYRRDEIDKSHYPIFHQMEGVKVFPKIIIKENDKDESDKLAKEQQKLLIERELKESLEQLAIHLFGSGIEMRWVDTYFPFTDPSFELEIFFDNEWLEVLGCGVIHPDILIKAGRAGEQGYAFGLGLERLAMVLFQIPDIRLFWSDDERFHQQFAAGKIVHFQSYSKYPPCFKDISFWIDNYESGSFHVNDLNELVRDVAGDLVEQVTLVDDFVHPKTKRTSHCYRITYRSMDRNLTNQEIDALQQQVRERTQQELGVELR